MIKPRDNTIHNAYIMNKAEIKKESEAVSLVLWLAGIGNRCPNWGGHIVECMGESDTLAQTPQIKRPCQMTKPKFFSKI